MKKIIIESTPNADSRTATGELNKEVILQDTKKHIVGVRETLYALSDEIIIIANNHDHTKLSHFNQFFEDFLKHRLDPDNVKFKELTWWEIHMTERHHLNDRCPENVNLLDVLEMIVDGVCAGKARSGEVYPIELSNDILQRAVKNTQKLLESNIRVLT